jgi:hypothetical protein
MHHVSKVYFYSVSDVLRDAASSNGGDGSDNLVTADRKRTSDQEEAEERSLALPLNNESFASSSCPSTPRISAAAVCELDYLDVNGAGEGLLFDSLPTLSHSPRSVVRTGTSSLRRKQKQRQQHPSNETMMVVADPQRSVSSGRNSPLMRSTTPSSSATQFPLTNGSLYSDLSLNRRVAESQRARRRVEREASLRAFSATDGSASSGGMERDSFNVTMSSLTTAHSDLDSMDNPLDASQHSVSSSGSTSSSCHTHMGFSAPSPPRLPRSHHPPAFFKRYFKVSVRQDLHDGRD